MILCNDHLSSFPWAVSTAWPCIVDISLGHFSDCRCISHLLQRLLLLGSCGLVLYTHLMNVFKHEYLSLGCPYLCQLEKICHHAALTLYCSVPYFWWCKPFVMNPSLPWHCGDPPWDKWHLIYEVGTIFSCVRCIAVLMQRPDLCPLLSWSLTIMVMDLAYGVQWVARTHKITIWKTLIIAARCNNLGVCSLQPVFVYFLAPLIFWSCAFHFLLW